MTGAQPRGKVHAMIQTNTYFTQPVTDGSGLGADGLRMKIGASARRQLRAEELAKLEDLLDRGIGFIDHPDFHRPDAEQTLIGNDTRMIRPDTGWYQKILNNLGGAVKARDHQTTLSNTGSEALFLKFNYCKYRVDQIIDNAKERSAGLSIADVRDLLKWHDAALGWGHQIARLNLGLVLAMAKRSYYRHLDFSDLVSEGNMALLRAIDKFDVSKGFKFSTYACRAILKSFSKLNAKELRYEQRFPAVFDPKMQRSNYTEEQRRVSHEERAQDAKEILIKNTANLTRVESSVLKHRFALGVHLKNADHARPLTLDAVGKIIGVTKERVRQIQNKALAKIRRCMIHDAR